MGYAYQASLALAVASANNIAASQSPGAGAITLNGTVGTGNLDAARRIIVTSGGNDTGITFTIKGTNRNGNSQTETIAGVSGGAASTTQDFLSVSSVTHTGSVASTVTVGTNGVASTMWLSIDRFVSPIEIGIGVVVSGTINYTVEYTYDDINAPFTGTFPAVFPYQPMAALTINADGQFSNTASALRLTQNSFTSPGTAKIIMTQAGIG